MGRLRQRQTCDFRVDFVTLNEICSAYATIANRYGVLWVTYLDARLGKFPPNWEVF